MQYINIPDAALNEKPGSNINSANRLSNSGGIISSEYMAVHFCILAGEQWTPRAAGNQSRGFPDSEARRRIREHVTVAAADQR